jgi:hypothetical protein
VKMRRYGIKRGALTNSRITQDRKGEFETLADAKQALAAHYKEQIDELTTKLASLATASLIDLFPEDAERWHRSITGRAS